MVLVFYGWFGKGGGRGIIGCNFVVGISLGVVHIKTHRVRGHFFYICKNIYKKKLQFRV